MYPAGDAAFDLVFFHHVIEHILDDTAALAMRDACSSLGACWSLAPLMKAAGGGNSPTKGSGSPRYDGSCGLLHSQNADREDAFSWP